MILARALLMIPAMNTWIQCEEIAAPAAPAATLAPEIAELLQAAHAGAELTPGQWLAIEEALNPMDRVQ